LGRPTSKNRPKNGPNLKNGLKMTETDLGRFWGGFWKLDAPQKQHFPDSKTKSETTLKIHLQKLETTKWAQILILGTLKTQK